MDGKSPTRPSPIERSRTLRGGGAREGSGTAELTSAAIVALFVASLVLPVNLEIAGILLTPYRLLLIPLFVPLAMRLVRESGVNAVDVLVALHVAWVALAVLLHEGTARVVYLGGTVIDSFGAYLVGRVLILNDFDYKHFFKCMLFSMLFLLPFAAIELLTRQKLLLDIADMIAVPNNRAGTEPRLGLSRVQAGFDHPILFGIFCSVAIANLLYIYRKEFLKRWFGAALASLMTLMSLSSAPLLSLLSQWALIFWGYLSQHIPGRWIVLVVSSALALLFLQLALSDGLLGFVIDNMTFDPRTGWGRTEIFEYGSAEVLRHPLFGIGFSEWVRPWWRKESVDNFWLVTAMRFGLPAALFFLAALLVQFLRVATVRTLGERQRNCRTGYLIAWVGVFITLPTVDVFSALGPFLMAYIGAGTWFYMRQKTEPDLGGMDARARRARAARAQAADGDMPATPPGTRMDGPRARNTPLRRGSGPAEHRRRRSGGQ